MIERNEVGTRPRLLLIVGGNSNAAKTFRRRVGAGNHYLLRTLVRNETEIQAGENMVLVRDYFTPTPDVFENVDAVINFTGLVKATADQLYHANTSGPATLAAAARASGVNHFVHLSSLSVYGNAEDIDASTRPAPSSVYGKSKLAGDEALAKLSSQDFTVTSLRVPILYNRSSRTKLHILAKTMISLQIFPVPHVQQPRSILHFENLAAAIEVVLDTKSGGVRFAADPQPFTFTSLVDGIGRYYGRRPKLLTMPEWVLRFVRKIDGNVYSSLYGRSLIANDALIVMSAAKTQSQCIDDIIWDAKQH